jgi:hypothetical protein
LISIAPIGQRTLTSGSVVAAAEALKPGEFLWAPEVAPEGPVLLIVSLKTQRAIIYRNGIPIGISTVSTGRQGFETPTGVFTVLQRRVEHYSRKYDNAPMPFMQRLTWYGIALHGGNLPGFPASHGCVRLPTQFARLLYGVGRLGMTVIITNDSAIPRIAPAGTLLGGAAVQARARDKATWQPQLAPEGPVSVVISARDGKMVVLRNGVIIGGAAVRVDGAIDRTLAFVLGTGGGQWLRVGLPGQASEPAQSLRGRIHLDDNMRRNVEAILKPGTTVVVTPDSLTPGDTGRPMTVIENEGVDQVEQ